MDRNESRTIPPYIYYIALGVASVALFWGTTTSYYHFLRVGTAIEESSVRRAVISVHDFLGIWGVIALASFPFFWPVIFFFRERIGGVWLKSFGWLCTAGFASILAGVLGGAESGGSFGALVGGKLNAAMGQGLSIALCLAALGMALFLATERFFSLPAAPTFDSTEQKPAPSDIASFASGLSVEESKQIAEEPKFDLEKVLEIEEEAPAPPPVAAPKPPAPVAAPQQVTPVVEPEEEPEIPAAPPTPVAEVEIEEEEEIAAPAPVAQRAEEKAVELQEAVERATKDFILPPPPAVPVFETKQEPETAAEEAPAKTGPAPAPVPLAAEPSASPGMLDSAARLVIQEGRASVSLLQRRLSIPFSRASLLLDLLEREGVIGPYRGGPARDILLSLADWEQKQKSGSPDPALPQA